MGLQIKDQGEFRVQQLLGIGQEILVGLVELTACGGLGALVAVERADHAHELGPVAGINQLPEAELALILVTDPGIIPHLIAVQQRQQLLPAQQRAKLSQSGGILGGDIEFRAGLVDGFQHVVFAAALAEGHGLRAVDAAYTVAAIQHLLTGFVHENRSFIHCFLYFTMDFRNFHVDKMDNLLSMPSAPHAQNKSAMQTHRAQIRLLTRSRS